MNRLILILFLLPSLLFAQDEKAYKLYGDAVEYYYQKDFQKAISSFEEAIKLKPDFQFAYYNKALALFEIKSYNEAIKDFSIVIKMDSSYVDAYKFRAQSYIKESDYERAISDLYSLIAFNPKVVEPFKNLGLCYYYTRQYKLANEAYQRYLESNIEDISIWFQKGRDIFQ